MARPSVLVAALLLLIGACASDGADTAPTAAATISLAPLPTVQPTTVPDIEATTSAVAETTSAAPAPTPAAPSAQLRRDGFSSVAFGTEAEAAIAAVTAELGPPTEDTGWVDPDVISSCPGTQVRRVTWGVLALLFGDQSPFASGQPHFFAWSYGDVTGLGGEPVGLLTPENVGLGATLAELRAAYPQVVVTPGEEGLVDTTFFVDDALRGILTGDTDAGTVTVLTGGPYCG